MRISKIAILAIRGGRETKRKLAEVLSVSENTIYRLLSENEDNGDLTKVAALQVIQEETGLSEDQVFEAEKESQEKSEDNAQVA